MAAEDIRPGDLFELRIEDEWWPRFVPERPVELCYLRSVDRVEHCFRIVGGGIRDDETGEPLAELSIYASSGGPGVAHLSGVKVSSGGVGLGRALLIKIGAELPPHLALT